MASQKEVLPKLYIELPISIPTIPVGESSERNSQRLLASLCLTLIKNASIPQLTDSLMSDFNAFCAARKDLIDRFEEVQKESSQSLGTDIERFQRLRLCFNLCLTYRHHLVELFVFLEKVTSAVKLKENNLLSTLGFEFLWKETFDGKENVVRHRDLRYELTMLNYTCAAIASQAAVVCNSVRLGNNNLNGVPEVRVESKIANIFSYIYHKEKEEERIVKLNYVGTEDFHRREMWLSYALGFAKSNHVSEYLSMLDREGNENPCVEEKHRKSIYEICKIQYIVAALLTFVKELTLSKTASLTGTNGEKKETEEAEDDTEKKMVTEDGLELEERTLSASSESYELWNEGFKEMSEEELLELLSLCIEADKRLGGNIDLLVRSESSHGTSGYNKHVISRHVETISQESLLNKGQLEGFWKFYFAWVSYVTGYLFCELFERKKGMKAASMAIICEIFAYLPVHEWSCYKSSFSQPSEAHRNKNGLEAFLLEIDSMVCKTLSERYSALVAQNYNPCIDQASVKKLESCELGKEGGFFDDEKFLGPFRSLLGNEGTVTSSLGKYSWSSFDSLNDVIKGKTVSSCKVDAALSETIVRQKEDLCEACGRLWKDCGLSTSSNMAMFIGFVQYLYCLKGKVFDVSALMEGEGEGGENTEEDVKKGFFALENCRRSVLEVSDYSEVFGKLLYKKNSLHYKESCLAEQNKMDERRRKLLTELSVSGEEVTEIEMLRSKGVLKSNELFIDTTTLYDMLMNAEKTVDYYEDLSQDILDMEETVLEQLMKTSFHSSADGSEGKSLERRLSSFIEKMTPILSELARYKTVISNLLRSIDGFFSENNKGSVALFAETSRQFMDFENNTMVALRTFLETIEKEYPILSLWIRVSSLTLHSSSLCQYLKELSKRNTTLVCKIPNKTK